MRTKEEIIADLNGIQHKIPDIPKIQQEIILIEVLIDIRDILAPISEIMVKRQKELMKWDKVPTDRGGKK